MSAKAKSIFTVAATVLSALTLSSSLASATSPVIPDESSSRVEVERFSTSNLLKRADSSEAKRSDRKRIDKRERAR